LRAPRSLLVNNHAFRLCGHPHNRKNWLFSNTPNGAAASAMLYSIVETAKANGLILYDYMVKCMKELAKAEPDIDALLPWNFKH
ncbi:transposase domain-containing protein, partial [Vibrio sp. ER1A]|uniref:transposase domain-containing protein n=1 Tax=Vibrio sp. ER1A TaxID=1517681 RepID=UPI00057017A0